MLDQRTEPLLQEIAATGADLLDQRLPECLGMDLRNAIRTAEQRRPVTLVIDTIEALHRSAPTQSGIGAFQNDAWLRELVWQAPGVGFVLLGRDDVEWPSFEHSPVRDWATIVETHRLGELSDAEVVSILEAFPITNADVAAAIREGAAGLPFYLGLQLDIFRDLEAEGVDAHSRAFRPGAQGGAGALRQPSGRAAGAGVRDPGPCPPLRCSAVPALEGAARHADRAVGLPEITRYSLVEGDADGYFRLHQHYQDIQREELARSRPDDQRRIDEALFAWWDAACQPPDRRSLDLAHETALREAAHHQRLLDAAGHVGWLASRWWPFQQAARLRLVEELWRTAMGLCERVNGGELRGNGRSPRQSRHRAADAGPAGGGAGGASARARHR